MGVLDNIAQFFSNLSNSGNSSAQTQPEQTAQPPAQTAADTDFGAEWDTNYGSGAQTQTQAQNNNASYDWYDPTKAYGRVSDGNGGYTNEYTFSHSARDLQAQLNKLAEERGDKTRIAVDGYYGPETAAAVAKYLGGAASPDAASSGAGTSTTSSPPPAGGNGAQALADSSKNPNSYYADQVKYGYYAGNPATSSSATTTEAPATPAPAPAAGSGGGGKQSPLATEDAIAFYNSLGLSPNQSPAGEGNYGFNSPAGNADFNAYKSGQMDAVTFRKRSGMTPEEWQRRLDQAAGGREDVLNVSPNVFGSGSTPGNFAGLTNEQLGRETPGAELEEEYNRRFFEEHNPERNDAANSEALWNDLLGGPAPKNYGYYYDGRSGNTMHTRYDEPIGPAAPVATQNYGNYYDGRSGNYTYPMYDTPVGPSNFMMTHTASPGETNEHVFNRWIQEDVQRGMTPEDAMAQAAAAQTPIAEQYRIWIATNLYRAGARG